MAITNTGSGSPNHPRGRRLVARPDESAPAAPVPVADHHPAGRTFALQNGEAIVEIQITAASREARIVHLRLRAPGVLSHGSFRCSAVELDTFARALRHLAAGAAPRAGLGGHEDAASRLTLTARPWDQAFSLTIQIARAEPRSLLNVFDWPVPAAQLARLCHWLQAADVGMSDVTCPPAA